MGWNAVYWTKKKKKGAFIFLLSFQIFQVRPPCCRCQSVRYTTGNKNKMKREEEREEKAWCWRWNEMKAKRKMKKRWGVWNKIFNKLLECFFFTVTNFAFKTWFFVCLFWFLVFLQPFHKQSNDKFQIYWSVLPKSAKFYRWKLSLVVKIIFQRVSQSTLPFFQQNCSLQQKRRKKKK